MKNDEKETDLLILDHRALRGAVSMPTPLRDHDPSELEAMAEVMPDKKGEPEVHFWPMYDRIIVSEDEEHVTAGPDSVILAPETSREPTMTGVIIDAGLGARDVMQSHGTHVGDRVMWARYAGVSGPNGGGKEHPRLSWKNKRVIFLMVKDIVANFTAAERFANGNAHITVDPDGHHSIEETKTDGN